MKLSAPNKPNHYALWNWLDEHPEAEKHDWPGFATMKKYDIPLPWYHCFLCHALAQDCESCPLCDLSGDVCEERGPYMNWAKGINRRANALKIRDCWGKP
jgi:hypothetical protein